MQVPRLTSYFLPQLSTALTNSPLPSDPVTLRDKSKADRHSDFVVFVWFVFVVVIVAFLNYIQRNVRGKHQ